MRVLGLRRKMRVDAVRPARSAGGGEGSERRRDGGKGVARGVIGASSGSADGGRAAEERAWVDLGRRKASEGAVRETGRPFFVTACSASYAFGAALPVPG